MNRTRIQLLLGYILNVHFLVWVLLGFSITYLLFFVIPVFFSAQVMQFFRYVPALDPIGIDLRYNLYFCDSWFIAKQSIYIRGFTYPPLACVLLTPLQFIEFSWAYRIVTLVNVFCYVVITLVFPLRTSKERQVSSILMLVFLTGLFSYGFQFELERGQINVIIAFMVYLAIWIFHFHNRYRFLAYILFTLSVQLKVFSLIFIVMLISNWQEWRNNLKRLLILATVNFSLLFVLGPHVFVDFIKRILEISVNPYVWVGNHSIRSFVTLALEYASSYGWAWLNQYSGLAQFALLAIVAVCILLIMRQTYLQNKSGINPYLLLSCTIGALLIPSVSHDYKLSILAASVAIFFSSNSFRERTNSLILHIIFIMLLIIFSFAYSSTLFSYTNKPPIFYNNLPALITMLLIITFLSLMSKPSLEGKISEPIEAD